MARLTVKLSGERFQALQHHAARRRTPVSWLIKDYIDYLLAGGQPVTSSAVGLPSGEELAAMAQHGGSFDWLADEPDLYSLDDGEPV
jgi:hypothetical protein